MANLKKPQRFFKGINSDISPSIQPDNTYRWAHNMDVVAQGDEFIFNQVKSIAQGIQVVTPTVQGITPTGGDPVQTPDGSFNILGFTQGIGVIGGIDRDCIVIFTAGISVSPAPSTLYKSTIFVYDCAAGALSVVGGDANPLSAGLDFPIGGSVDAIVTRDRGIPIVYFVDGFNVQRRFVLDDSVYLTYTSVDELSVPRLKASSSTINNAEVGFAGTLLAGTYQFAFRLKNTTIGNFTKWSLFTNPIPIIPENQGVVYGGAVGEVTDKSIELDIVVTNDEEALYDVIELATIKNNTGENITQEVAFVSTHEIIDNTNVIIYAGAEAEYELPVTEIVVDDAAVERVERIVETNNRVIVGSVKYFDRLLSDANGSIKSAVSIKRSVDYADVDDSQRYIGHFRKEVYRYGLTYVDRYGNWSAVKPLDFSEFKRTTPTATNYTISSLTQRNNLGSGYSTNVTSVVLTSGGADFTTGDVIRINFGTTSAPDFKYYDVYERSSNTLFFAAYEALPTITPTDVTLRKCLGNAYSHSASADWKYVNRDKFGYSVLDSDGDAQALGLRVVIDGTTHPDWAVGVAVVRMERDKNVLYQTPLVHARNVVGVCTPGKNTSTNNDYPIGSSGVGAFDHLAPKILQLGVSRDMIWQGLIGDGTPAYQALSFRSQTNTAGFVTGSGIDNRWDVAFAPAVDFVANNLGVALQSVPENQDMDISLVDIAAFTKTAQPSAAGAKVYECLSKSKYFHDGTISSHKIEDPANAKQFFSVVFPRIQDTVACQYKYASQGYLTDVNAIRTEEIYPIVNNAELVPLDSNASSYLGAKAVRLVAGESLVTQQATTSSIPAASRDLFLGNIAPQRTLAVKMNQQILDPLSPISKIYDPTGITYVGREVLWSNYLAEPGVAGATVSKRLYDNTDMTVAYRGSVEPAGLNPSLPALLVDRLTGEGENVNLAQAMFVVKMELGKTDFRYGAANATKRYIWTGAYAPITNTTDITIDVWGGDCVISEFTYRVNDNTVIPRIYIPLTGQDNVSWGAVNPLRSANAAKAGASQQQPEFIRMFVEAECNAEYISDNDRFPVKDDGISDYTAPAFYNYNFGYSIRNTAKAFFSQDQTVNFIQDFPARLLFSDARVSQSNDDGYSRFRALNFYDLEEKYGGVTRLVLLNDSEPIAVQGRAIRYLFVGKNIIQDEGGTVLSVQSGQFFSDVVKYLSITYGAQSIRCVLSTEYGVFVLDNRNGMLLNVSDGIKLLSQGRIDKFLNDQFSSKDSYFERRLSLSYDSVAKELNIIGYRSNANVALSVMNWIKYNAKIDSFVSSMDYNVASSAKNYTLPSFVVGVGGVSYLLHTNFNAAYYSGGWNAVTLQIGKMREGATFGQLLLGSTAQAAYIDFVSNEAPDEPKTFAIVGSNSLLPFTSYNVTAFNEQQASETTGNQTTEIYYRNGQSYAPFIRDTTQGGRLRGMYAIIRLSWSQTNAAARIYSVFSQFRKSFRP